MIHIRVETDQGSTDHQLDEVYLRPSLKSSIVRILRLEPDDKTSDDQKRIQMLIRTAVKGVLITAGDGLLNALYRSKEHPRPGKKDDLIEWYLTFAVDQFINFLLRHDVIFTGQQVNGTTIKLTEVHTRSNTQEASTQQ